jgi:hypothetical protein
LVEFCQSWRLKHIKKRVLKKAPQAKLTSREIESGLNRKIIIKMHLWGLVQIGWLSFAKVGGLSMFSKLSFGVFGFTEKSPTS